MGNADHCATVEKAFEVLAVSEDANDFLTQHLDKLYQTPTFARRRDLQESKAFFCRCDRCMGPDFLRQIWCPRSDCPSFVKCIDDGSGPLWSCDNCGEIQDANIYVKCKEAAIEREIISMEREMKGNCMHASTWKWEEMVKKSEETPGPLHFLTLRAMECCSRLCASQALEISMLDTRMFSPMIIANLALRFGSAERLRVRSAEMLLRIVSAGECIAAGCNGTACDVGKNSTHAPVYECSQNVFFACQDLIKCRHQCWPPLAAATARRYIPYMRILYGETDVDVGNISKEFRSIEASTSVASETSVKVTTETSETINRRPTDTIDQREYSADSAQVTITLGTSLTQRSQHRPARQKKGRSQSNKKKKGRGRK